MLFKNRTIKRKTEPLRRNRRLEARYSQRSLSFSQTIFLFTTLHLLLLAFLFYKKFLPLKKVEKKITLITLIDPQPFIPPKKLKPKPKLPTPSPPKKKPPPSPSSSKAVKPQKVIKKKQAKPLLLPKKIKQKKKSPTRPPKKAPKKKPSKKLVKVNKRPILKSNPNKKSLISSVVISKPVQIFDKREVKKKLHQAINKIEKNSPGPSRLPKNSHANFYAKIRRQMYSSWKYPSNLDGKNLSAQVSMTIVSRRKITKVRISRSSGNSIFDQTAIRAVRSHSLLVSPLPSHHKLEIFIYFRQD